MAGRRCHIGPTPLPQTEHPHETQCSLDRTERRVCRAACEPLRPADRCGGRTRCSRHPHGPRPPSATAEVLGYPGRTLRRALWHPGPEPGAPAPDDVRPRHRGRRVSGPESAGGPVQPHRRADLLAGHQGHAAAHGSADCRSGHCRGQGQRPGRPARDRRDRQRPRGGRSRSRRPGPLGDHCGCPLRVQPPRRRPDVVVPEAGGRGEPPRGDGRSGSTARVRSRGRGSGRAWPAMGHDADGLPGAEDRQPPALALSPGVVEQRARGLAGVCFTAVRREGRRSAGSSRMRRATRSRTRAPPPPSAASGSAAGGTIVPAGWSARRGPPGPPPRPG